MNRTSNKNSRLLRISQGQKGKLARTMASIAIPVASFLGPIETTKAYSPNNAEKQDDIVCAFFYGWWGNQIYRQKVGRGGWEHWSGDRILSPPKTWASYYIPNYPDSDFNPIVQLYDSLDPEVLRWQDRAMATAGIDIAINNWHIPGNSEDRTLAKAIRMCKSVKWCIYYCSEGKNDPPPQTIYSDIKHVIDTNGSSGNYAKIDGKWLVFIYMERDGIEGRHAQAAERWKQAKEMLAADGYEVYLNADMVRNERWVEVTSSDPWDAVHDYYMGYKGITDTIDSVDDSATITPGYWHYEKEVPRLVRSLDEYKSALQYLVLNKEKFRFLCITAWNDYHEGKQIEPSQEIIPDPNGYYPSGYNYDYDFIDAIGPTAITELQWTSSGHRPIVPVKLEAEDLIWEDETVAEGDLECRIKEEGTRIGSSVYVPYSVDGLVLSVGARAIPIVSTPPSRSGKPALPEMLLYLNHEVAGQWDVDPSDYSKEYVVALPLDKGNHTLEIAFRQPENSNWDLVVKYLEISLPALPSNFEGFESGDFTLFPWMHYGNANWSVVSDESNSGNYGAKAGSINDDESSSLEVILDCIDGEVSFYRKVSSERSYDYLRFYIDGIEKGEWSGEEDWTQTSYPVTEGRITFTWTYSKDGSVSRGDDTAYIDDIVFPVY